MKDIKEKESDKLFLKIITVMWLVNFVFFFACLLIHDYSLNFNGWYTGAFAVLSTGFGLSKILLSIFLIIAIRKYCGHTMLL